MNLKKRGIVKISWVIVIFMIINIGIVPAKSYASESEKLYVDFSLNSPQEPGENIKVLAEFSEDGLYSYYVKEIGGEYKALSENTKDKRFMWTPDKKGKYIIKVECKTYEKTYITTKSYEITEDNRASIGSIDINEGDLIDPLLDYDRKVKIILPKEAKGDDYEIKLFANNEEVTSLDKYPIGSTDDEYVVTVDINELMWIEETNINLEFIIKNNSKDRIEDRKKINVKNDFIGIRNDFNVIKEDGVKIGEQIDIVFNPSIDVEGERYSFYYIDLNGGEKHYIEEEIEDNKATFIPEKEGKYLLVGEINYKRYNRTLSKIIYVNENNSVDKLYEDNTQTELGRKISESNNSISRFRKIDIKLSYDKEYIYENKSININTIMNLEDKDKVQHKLYVKSPSSEKYELLKLDDYNRIDYSPKEVGDYKLKAEFIHNGKTYIANKDFYARSVPKDDKVMELKELSIVDTGGKANIYAGMYFYVDFLIEQSDYGKDSDIEYSLVIKNKDGIIRNSGYIINSLKESNLYLIENPGDYTIDIEFKNKNIDTDVIKKSYDIKVYPLPLVKDINMDTSSNEIRSMDTIDLATFSHRIEKYNSKEDDMDYDVFDDYSEYSFYVRKKGDTKYLPIVERTESSAIRYMPTNIGEYEFKTIIHIDHEDYEFEGGNIKVDYAYEDVDKDDSINIKDLALVASKYNDTKTSTNWNDYYDFNKDGVINIFDLVRLAKKI